jgi:Holliday junction resolvasome RuvABC endonuclease subunit
MGHYQASYNEQNDTERFDRISDWAIGILDCVSLGGVKVGLEDYAFSAQGLVYKIGENTGMLKYKMYTNGIPFELVSNSKPKKLATGKGNADKNSVYDAFVAETGWNIHHHIKSKSGKIASPLSDIADSYWICKWLFQKNAIASESSSLPSSP